MPNKTNQPNPSPASAGDSQWLTYDQTAAYLNMTTRQLRRKVKAGIITPHERRKWGSTATALFFRRTDADRIRKKVSQRTILLSSLKKALHIANVLANENLKMLADARERGITPNPDYEAGMKELVSDLTETHRTVSLQVKLEALRWDTPEPPPSSN